MRANDMQNAAILGSKLRPSNQTDFKQSHIIKESTKVGSETTDGAPNVKKAEDIYFQEASFAKDDNTEGNHLSSKHTPQNRDQSFLDEHQSIGLDM